MFYWRRREMFVHGWATELRDGMGDRLAYMLMYRHRGSATLHAVQVLLKSHWRQRAYGDFCTVCTARSPLLFRILLYGTRTHTQPHFMPTLRTIQYCLHLRRANKYRSMNFIVFFRSKLAGSLGPYLPKMIDFAQNILPEHKKTQGVAIHTGMRGR